MTLVGVLGPVRLWRRDGAEIPLGSRRQRRLLAALALHAGAVVDIDTVVDLVWESAPACPAPAVQTLVARLRAALPDGASVDTESRGYRLVVGQRELDARAFAEHLDLAARCPDAADRLVELGAAMALWRGRPFADLDHPAVTVEIARLTELWTVALEQRAAALLAIGRCGEAIAELQALTTAEPLREGAVGLLMRALTAVGRQGEALGVYTSLRNVLSAELGLDPSPELRRVHEQVLRQDLPIVTGPSDRPRLPVSSFVGRSVEMAAVAGALERCRLVTVCGPGGVGKTRLARHVAAAVVGRYADGVVMVDLEDARSSEDFVAAVAGALRISPTAEEALAKRIVSVLAVRRQLLVLDTCEHLGGSVARLVETITIGVDGVDVLATSREPLRADGEQVLRLGPLGPIDAAALLGDRIRAADSSVELDSTVLAQVSSRLDGLPLACELAAARVSAIGLPSLLKALEEPFALLNSGRRTAAPRHRSLREVVQWSVDLLDDGQRELFARLARFAGAVEPAAVNSVCGHLDVLPDLVDQSLVLRMPGEPPRYGMLEILRVFGRSELADGLPRGEFDRRRAKWATTVVAEVAAARLGPGEPAAVHRFDAHLPDIRETHAWLLATGHIDDLLAMDVLLAELAFHRGRADLSRLVEQSLTRLTGPDASNGPAHPLLARLLGLAAQRCWQHGDIDTGEQRCRQAVALAAEAGDPEAARDAYECWGNIHQLRGDWSAARSHLHRAIALARRARDPFTEALALTDLVLTESYAGDDAIAETREIELAHLAKRAGAPTMLAMAAYAAGERRAERDPAAAAPFLQDAITHAATVDMVIAGYARHTLLTTSARTADPARALPQFAQLIDYWHGVGAWGTLWLAIRALAETVSRLGWHAEAVLLIAAHDASPHTVPAVGADAARLTAAMNTARLTLGDKRVATVSAQGRMLTDDGAVALARRLAQLPV